MGAARVAAGRSATKPSRAVADGYFRAAFYGEWRKSLSNSNHYLLIMAGRLFAFF
jgi:hypothetical protein